MLGGDRAAQKHRRHLNRRWRKISYHSEALEHGILADSEDVGRGSPGWLENKVKDKFPLVRSA
jgi:hypothetical protein